MLDIKRIRENLDDIKKAMDRRGEKGFDLDAVIALDDERRLDDISKEIYQPIAQLFFCYINSVERNLRTVSRRAWTLQREHFQEIAGCELPAPPTASAFLRILVNHLRTNVLPTESTEPTVQ